jgi:hypothetical protein
MSTKGVYVLECRWCCDNFNHEYATLTVEEPEEGFEALNNPLADRLLKNDLMDRIKEVLDALNNNLMGPDPELIAIYRIEWLNGSQHVRKKETKKKGIFELKMRMKLICRFDAGNNPVPV